MKFSMAVQEKSDPLMQVTEWSGVTVVIFVIKKIF